MSYTIDLIVAPLPDDDPKAWKKIHAMRESYYDDERDKAPSLVALHAVLTACYPCLSSYADDDAAAESSPWADGPMIDNFAHDMGMLAISFTQADALLPFIIQEANALGITVADGQSEKIFRPKHSVEGTALTHATPKPWWKFWK